MPSEFHIPPRGVIPYQSFEVDPGFAEDRWIRGAEIRPGNRRVVHHCNVFLKDPHSREALSVQGELGSICLAATTPGTPPMLLPEGMAKRLPAGWHLLFVVHYTTTGTPEADRTSLGLVFADPHTVRKEVATNLMLDTSLSIPPFARDHRVERSERMDRDVLLLAMFPHMHLRGKSFRYEATFPDGRSEILLDVPRYDFHWQGRYELAEPRRLPAGTTLRCVAHYDNSASNPNNPDPGALVQEGPRSTDEMFNGYYDLALADQDLTRPRSPFGSLREAFASPPGWLASMACLSTLLWVIARRSRNFPKTFGWGGLMAAGFALAAIPVFLGVLNHDVAWWQYLSGRVLAGDRLYVDLIETNPPMNCWLNFAPIGLSRISGISEITSLRLLMLGLIAASLASCDRILRVTCPERPGARRWTLALTLLALLPAAGYDFAQREHLMLVLIFPAILMASGRAAGRDFGGKWPWLVGIMAGVGIALKPHFALAWLAVEVALAASRRDWRSVIPARDAGDRGRRGGLPGGRPGRLPGILADALVVAPLYGATGRVSLATLAGKPATALAIVSAMAYAISRAKGDGRGVWIAADLGFLAVAFSQDKGYDYHFYPSLGLSLVLIGLLVADAGEKGKCPFIPRLCLAVLLAATCSGVVADRVAESLCWRGEPVESDSPFGRMARVARDHARGGKVQVFSTALAATFPLSNYTEAAPSSRHFSLWFLPAFYPLGEISTRSLGEMGNPERRLLDEVVGDLLAARPALLLVDESGHKPAFGGRPFDYLAYYSADPKFVEFMRDYKSIDRVDSFRVYRRNATPSRPSLSLRTVR